MPLQLQRQRKLSAFTTLAEAAAAAQQAREAADVLAARRKLQLQVHVLVLPAAPSLIPMKAC